MSATFDKIADIITETCDIPRENIKPESHAINDLEIDSLDFLQQYVVLFFSSAYCSRKSRLSISRSLMAWLSGLIFSRGISQVW